jgi:hypothetical protein
LPLAHPERYHPPAAADSGEERRMVGDHIRALKGGRWNHAIDCGDETVIHLDEDGSERPAIRRSYRPEFVSGASVVEVVSHRSRAFPADEVVARAYSRIANPALAAMFLSSESFAEWCATGRASPSAAEAGRKDAATRTTAKAGPARPRKPPARARPAAPARGKTGSPRSRPAPGTKAARRASKAGGRAKPRAPRRARRPGRRRR